MGSRGLVFLFQPPNTCSEPPDIIPSPQLLQFRLRGEQECQQSGIQKGIQAWFNIERRRALKEYAHFPVLSFAKKTGGMEEGVKGWGEERKKCLGWALCVFYLVGSLPRRGLPPAESAGRSNERREKLLPPTAAAPSPQGKGEEERANGLTIQTVPTPAGGHPVSPQHPWGARRYPP